MQRLATWLVLLGVLWCVPHASAQRVLLGQFGDFEFPYFTGAILDLGLQDVTTVTVRQDDFLDELRSLRYELVIVRSIDLFQPGLEDAILTELEAHVARGGKLHFQMADLDRASGRYLDLLGLEAAVELELPLFDIFVPTPPHPIWDSPLGGLFPVASEVSPDYGDALIVGAGTFAVGTFGEAGRPAIVIARSGRIVVNGQQWDNWQSGTSVIGRQFQWLLSCPADLDGDGDLTVFDFFEFQNLFDAGDPRADVFYDGRLDVFDFLQFFNQFEDGC